jgi:hypothetical protein
LRDREWFESENQRTRDQRAINVKVWVVSSGTDQPQISTFDIGQEDILLRFIEMVNLIDEYDRFPSRGPKPIGGRGNHLAHFRHVTFDSA